MDIVSCSQTILLNNFPDFQHKSTHGYNATDGKFNFQFFKEKKLFFVANPQGYIELLRIKNVNGEDKISSVKKIRMDNLRCIASPKCVTENIAVGLASGNIKLINYKKSECTQSFIAELQNSSVQYLDYSSCDEYLAGLLENGSINIYGMKTVAKLDTINIDKNSSVAKFHPLKRFHLGIASNKGAVTIYDIQTKRKSFHSADCHAAPCRDICMSPVNEYCLLSVGYDRIINIYDTRKKTIAQQIRQNHPLSAIAISNCGQYCCVGNLKGELIAYDFRNISKSLNEKKVHDNGVDRIAFVPHVAENEISNMTAANYQIQQQVTSINDSKQNLSNFKMSDSANNVSVDMFDLLPNENLINNRDSVICRDSFMSFLLAEAENNRKHDMDNSSRLSLGTQSVRNSNIASFKHSRYSDVETVNVSFLKNRDEKRNVTIRSTKSTASSSEQNQKIKIKKDCLKEIEEENHVINEVNDQLDNKTTNESHGNIIDAFNLLPAHKNSTPNNYKPKSKVESINTDGDVNNANVGEIVKTIFNEISQVKCGLQEDFNRAVQELKLNIETNTWNTYNHSFYLWNKHQEKMHEMESKIENLHISMGLMLQNDNFVNDYLNIKRENEVLKEKIEELTLKK